MVQDCLFCRIFAGQLEAKEVLRRDNILAFEDIRPVAPTHVVVIPKLHIPSMREVTAEHGSVLAEMFAVANQVAIDRHVDKAGYRLTINTGPQAGQSVYHLHLHVLGGRMFSWPPG